MVDGVIKGLQNSGISAQRQALLRPSLSGGLGGTACVPSGTSPNNGFTASRNRSVHTTDSVPPKWRIAPLTATLQSLPSYAMPCCIIRKEENYVRKID